MAARGGDKMTDAYAPEADAFVGLFDTQDQTEGVNAFLEKTQAPLAKQIVTELIMEERTMSDAAEAEVLFRTEPLVHGGKVGVAT